jgi:glycosyltransferase involved in cell wall biosynthesis
MLVPHDPDADPRIGWVADLCSTVADTTIIGTTWSTDRPMRTHRGTALVERVYVPASAGTPAKALGVLGTMVRKRSPAADRRLTGSAMRFFSAWTWYWLIVDALYRRARAESIRPTLIVCHDLFGLIVGARLRKRWGVPLLYDAHEYWPQANLLHEPWEESLLTRVERRLIRKADQVVTVSPPLAAHLERVYGIRGVLSVPNAAPGLYRRAPARTPGGPVHFLLQGQLAAGRGVELLLDAWAKMDSRAVLQMRYVPNDYATGIERRFAPLFESGRVERLAPVGEDELVEAAAGADVGVVPYVGPNLNHLYASPNKVSQYMQAGLALLVSSDMQYVASLLERYGCGVTYDPHDPETLREAVELMARDPQELGRMQRAAATATDTEFNWEAVSGPYGDAIRRLLERTPSA